MAEATLAAPPARTGGRRDWHGRAAIAGAGALALGLAAFARPIDHDEGQYVAAAILAWRHLPYRDFDYLQTPLQPLLAAPLARIAGGHALAVLRLANAALTAATTALLIGALRRLGAPARAAMALGLLFLAIEPVLFAAATARNDALPMALAAAALAALVALHRFPAGGGAGRLSFAVGLAAMAAAMAKISYLVPFAAIVLVGGWQWRRGETPIRPLPFALGALVAIAPLVALAAMAPARALFDVVRFPARAPAEWYLAQGLGWRLGVAGRLLTFAKFLMLGAAPVLLAFRLARPGRGGGDPLAAQLDALIVAGAIAAVLPAPVWRQYLVPMMAPLVLRAGLALEGRMPARGWRIAAAGGALAGLAISILQLGVAAMQGWPLLAGERSAAMAMAQARAAAPAGTIVTLSPEVAGAAGDRLDPRFAAGPFLFRTRDGLGDDGWLIGVSRRSAPARLAADPPAAFILGGATADRDGALDRDLARWALAHGYRAVSRPGEPLRVLVRGAR